MPAPFACKAGVDVGAEIGLPAALRAGQERIELVVVGAHLEGLPLNPQLQSLGANLVDRTRTAADYRLFALPDTSPPKPGLSRDPGFVGPGVEVEIWSLEPAAFGRFVAAIPAPLGIGKICLSDGRRVSGFLCESNALNGAKDITKWGGWRNYLASASIQ
uniref:Allophanate hydrolase n=1 Tax=Brevundimonas diminuta TaxID=293 RepID=G8DNW0_BREDI|nr:allophanate hydrolase [Brevundimonas diminuta]